MTVPSQRTLLVAVPVVVIFAILTWPVWRWLWEEWWANDYYSHGILIPPVSAFLVYMRFQHDPALKHPVRRGTTGGLVLTALSLACYLYALNGRAYYLAAFAMIGMIGGLTWTFGGTEVAKRLAFPIAYLALMVPLPIVERVTYPLAIFTGICSTSLAQTLGLDVVINGNAVSVPNADMVIGAQCSGINSMISLTALMLLAAYLLDGPLWGRVLLVAMAVPLALLGNILRVASLLFIADEWGAQAAFSYYHDYSGWVFFVIVLLLMLPITRVLQCTSVRTEVI